MGTQIRFEPAVVGVLEVEATAAPFIDMVTEFEEKDGSFVGERISGFYHEGEEAERGLKGRERYRRDEEGLLGVEESKE